MKSFEEVWTNIRAHQGEKFFTPLGLEFFYSASDDFLLTSRTDYTIAKCDIQKAYEVGALTSIKQIDKIVKAPSYIFGILTDERIK